MRRTPWICGTSRWVHFVCGHVEHYSDSNIRLCPVLPRKFQKWCFVKVSGSVLESDGFVVEVSAGNVRFFQTFPSRFRTVVENKQSPQFNCQSRTSFRPTCSELGEDCQYIGNQYRKACADAGDNEQKREETNDSTSSSGTDFRSTPQHNRINTLFCCSSFGFFFLS